MSRLVIQFHNSDIKQVDNLFNKFFSTVNSPLDTHIVNLIYPYPGQGPIFWSAESPNSMWVIIYLNEYDRIGGITYQPVTDRDLLIFDFNPDFTEIVQQLINEIKIRMEKKGFNIIPPYTVELAGQEFEEFMDKISRHPSLSPDEWGEDNEIVNEGIEPKISQLPKTEKNVNNLLSDIKLMKNFYKDYNPITANLIYKKIPIAWNNRQSEGGRWGPGFVSELCNLNTTTVSRYLRAFYCAGLREVDFDGEKIVIPYKPRSAP